MSRFKQAMPHVLKHEGGFVNHPRDPGGATNFGITIGTLSDHFGRPATVDEVRDLDKATVYRIYRRGYWDAVRADELPPGVDYAVFDFAVNSGPARAARFLQDVVGVKQDGIIGPITLAAVRAMPPTAIIERLCANRLAFLRRLSTWDAFGRGWERRVNEVWSVALAKAADAAANPAKMQEEGSTMFRAWDKAQQLLRMVGIGGGGAAIGGGVTLDEPYMAALGALAQLVSFAWWFFWDRKRSA